MPMETKAVSNREISEIQRSLGRIEGDAKSILDNIKKINDNMAVHDTRIRKIEGRHNWMMGFAGAISLAGTWFMNKIMGA